MPDPATARPVPRSAREAASLARDAVAASRVATLVAYARHPAGQHTTAVQVTAREDGSVEVALAATSPAVGLLLARPLATVSLAPPGRAAVLLHGSARRRPGTRDDGRLVFHVEAAAVRVGEHCRPVDPREYAARTPSRDVAQDRAARLLAHLDAAHGELLARHLRAAGLEVGFAVATHLDVTGLTVQVAHRRGVDTVRLAFPEPLRSAEQLPAALAALLRTGCACS